MHVRRRTTVARSLIGRGDSIAAERACRVIGATPTRLEVLRMIVAFEDISTAELIEALDLTRNGVLRHLKVLKSEGLISATRTTHPRGAGPITYWRADVDELGDVLESLSHHLLAGR
jgi:DNA-binding transcriptional ArsR family regulator